MIRIKYLRNKELYQIEVRGHANYDRTGKDIVCSSVSTAVLLTANVFGKINKDIQVQQNEDESSIILKVENCNATEKAILDNLVEFCEDLSFNYHQYVRIKEVFKDAK